MIVIQLIIFTLYFTNIGIYVMIANIQQKEIYDVFSAQVQVPKAVFEQNI